jgi:dolichol-phosphate mannosyltransferase
LTVVVPVFDEQESLPEFHRRLSAVLDGLALTSEVLFVDDGSSDGSHDVLAGFRRDDPRVRVISLSRNFGHQIAVSAGLDEARGEAVVVIDSDLQDPPELIPTLVDKWREGYEVVHAVRTARRGETRFKRWTASAFYRLIRSWTDLNIQLDAGDFRLMGRQAVDALRSMPEQFRFVRGMTAWVGFEQTGVPYERDSRYAGDSKYPLRRMVRLAMTAITSFSFVPLQLASVFGFIVSGLAAIAVPIVVALRLLGAEGLGGQTTVLLAVLFFGGVQLLFLGVLGEYLGRISVEVKRRPLYFVDRAEHRPLREPDDNP